MSDIEMMDSKVVAGAFWYERGLRNGHSSLETTLLVPRALGQEEHAGKESREQLTVAAFS